MQLLAGQDLQQNANLRLTEEFLANQQREGGQEMQKKKKSVLVLAMVPALIVAGFFMPGLVGAGNLEPPGDPDDPASAMYTIEDLYNYLDTGDPGAKRGFGFVEPTSPPAPDSMEPTLDDVHAKIADRYITCEGTLEGTRWCDNGDGTVKDMTTGLVWLKDASCMGQMSWYVAADANIVHRGCKPSDNSDDGDWRLPTKNELNLLSKGTEAVGSRTPRAFTRVQQSLYWSSTTRASNPDYACYVSMYTGYVNFANKNIIYYYVWPVRSDN